MTLLLKPWTSPCDCHCDGCCCCCLHRFLLHSGLSPVRAPVAVQFNLEGVPMLVYFAPTTFAAHSKSVLPPAFQHEDHSAETIASAFVKGYTGVQVRGCYAWVVGVADGDGATACRCKVGAPHSAAAVKARPPPLRATPIVCGCEVRVHVCTWPCVRW